MGRIVLGERILESEDGEDQSISEERRYSVILLLAIAIPACAAVVFRDRIEGALSRLTPSVTAWWRQPALQVARYARLNPVSKENAPVVAPARAGNAPWPAQARTAAASAYPAPPAPSLSPLQPAASAALPAFESPREEPSPMTTRASAVRTPPIMTAQTTAARMDAPASVATRYDRAARRTAPRDRATQPSIAAAGAGASPLQWDPSSRAASRQERYELPRSAHVEGTGRRERIRRAPEMPLEDGFERFHAAGVLPKPAKASAEKETVPEIPAAVRIAVTRRMVESSPGNRVFGNPEDLDNQNVGPNGRDTRPLTDNDAQPTAGKEKITSSDLAAAAASNPKLFSPSKIQPTEKDLLLFKKAPLETYPYALGEPKTYKSSGEPGSLSKSYSAKSSGEPAGVVTEKAVPEKQVQNTPFEKKTP